MKQLGWAFELRCFSFAFAEVLVCLFIYLSVECLRVVNRVTANVSLSNYFHPVSNILDLLLQEGFGWVLSGLVRNRMGESNFPGEKDPGRNGFKTLQNTAKIKVVLLQILFQ